MQKYICYTDGSYQSSLNQGQGSGGGASIILNEKEQIVIKLYQGFTHTTNNRMELRAVIETLKYLPEGSEITIVSDSQYVLDNIQNHNAEKGVKENQLERPNYDLGFELVELLPKHKLNFQGVKGHNGNKGNEEADKGCTFAAQCINLERDIGALN